MNMNQGTSYVTLLHFICVGRYVTTLKSESPSYHLDEDDRVYPDDVR